MNSPDIQTSPATLSAGRTSGFRSLWRKATGRRARNLIWSLLIVAMGILIVLRYRESPRTYGYVYDHYHPGIVILHETGRFPRLEDAWGGYHPPLFYALGLPFYAAGVQYHEQNPDLSPRGVEAHALKFALVMPALCGLWIMIYSWRILRLLRQRGWRLLLAMAIVFAFPCLFITAGGIDGDILVAALMVTLFYYLLRYTYQARPHGWRLPAVIGIVAGLVMATKYSGLLGLLIAGAVVGLKWLQGPGRLLRIRDGLLILAVALAIGSWKYIDNFQRYGTPIKANADAYDYRLPGQRESYLDYYEFDTLRMGELLELMDPETAPRGKLTFLPVYRSVWTTLHAMAWGDMSFFNDPTRFGGALRYGYRSRQIPPWLSSSVLVLGLVANALMLIGLLTTAHRRLMWPVTLMVVITLLVYFSWVTNAKHWQLKTKYILFLLPFYALYISYGFAWLRRRLPRVVWGAAAAALAALIVLAHGYLYEFAVR